MKKIWLVEFVLFVQHFCFFISTYRSSMYKKATENIYKGVNIALSTSSDSGENDKTNDISIYEGLSMDNTIITDDKWSKINHKIDMQLFITQISLKLNKVVCSKFVISCLTIFFLLIDQIKRNIFVKLSFNILLFLFY